MSDRLLHEDATFSVYDRGARGVEIAFEGEDAEEDASGSKWFVDGAAEQVRIAMLRRPPLAEATAFLSRRTGILPVWDQEPDRPIWRRERDGGGFVEMGIVGEPDEEGWLVTPLDEHGTESLAELPSRHCTARQARTEANRIARTAVTAPGLAP